MHNLPRQRQGSGTDTVAHFGELKEPCLRFIEESQIVVGCVAWITDPDIMKALSGRFVALVVQKENWWKKGDARGMKLAEGYSNLTGGLPASSFPPPLKSFGEVGLAPIACMGGTGGGNGYGNPLMHHKFIIRCKAVKGKLVPVAVWTGSFNFSTNANSSFENAVEIHDPAIAQAYLDEFSIVASLSEKMNWRIGVATPGNLGVAYVPPKPKARKTVPARKGAGAAKRATRKR